LGLKKKQRTKINDYLIFKKECWRRVKINK